jgi:hypothetical protein
MKCTIRNNARNLATLADYTPARHAMQKICTNQSNPDDAYATRFELITVTFVLFLSLLSLLLLLPFFL